MYFAMDSDFKQLFYINYKNTFSFIFHLGMN